MKIIITLCFFLVLIPAIILIWLIIITEIKDYKKENLRKNLQDAAKKSDEALLDYVYNHFKL